MTIKIQDNGYEARGIQRIISIFNTVAGKLFPECEVEHFYYGDKLSMTDVRLEPGRYAHFNISEKRVSLNGYTCSRDDLILFQNMTHNDELYKGKLMQLAQA